MLTNLDQKRSHWRKTYTARRRLRHKLQSRGQRSIPQPVYGIKPKPIDGPGSAQLYESENPDSQKRTSDDFQRCPIRRPSQQSALSDDLRETDDDIWQDLTAAPSDSRPELARESRKRCGVWTWHAIVPSHTCSGSPAAKAVVSLDAW